VNGGRVLHHLAGGLVVSCQASAPSPVRHTPTIARIAQAAVLGGAVGIRANGVDDVASIAALAQTPLIGLLKTHNGVRDVITTSFAHAQALVDAGATVVALEVTAETDWVGAELVARVHDELGVPVMADVSTLDEGLRAWEAGADLVGTTLSGYTPASRAASGAGPGPDLALVGQLAHAGVRTVAEGRISSPEAVSAAFEHGAFAVVVGGAITDPLLSTRRFAAVAPRARPPAAPNGRGES